MLNCYRLSDQNAILRPACNKLNMDFSETKVYKVVAQICLLAVVVISSESKSVHLSVSKSSFNLTVHNHTTGENPTKLIDLRFKTDDADAAGSHIRNRRAASLTYESLRPLAIDIGKIIHRARSAFEQYVSRPIL